MIRVTHGDLFDSGAQTLCNTVNCVGVMGKGLASSFKRRFPAMFADYVERCRRGDVRLGEPYLWRGDRGPWVLNFPTKDHWRAHSRLSDVEAGLDHLTRRANEWGIIELAMPPLGCGLGGLDWGDVGPAIHRRLAPLDLRVLLYPPADAPPAQQTLAFLAADRVTDPVPPAWIALVAVVARIRQSQFHWPIGRTTFQKLAYFATALGVPTGLRFQRASYGPFSRDVKPMLARLFREGLLVEERRGRMFAVREGPAFDDACRGNRDHIAAWGDQLAPIVDLFSRVRTTVDAELAATVHFLSREKQTAGETPTEMTIYDEIRAWKGDRVPDDQIADAVRALNTLGWVELIGSAELPVPDLIG